MNQLPTQTAVATASLRPNPWNTNHCSPEAEEKIRNSIRRFGLFKPIVVRTLNDGTLEILGGEHRWRAAQDLGMATVPVVNLGKVPDKTAKEIGLVDNGRYGEDNSVELAQLLRELDASEVATFMPFSDDELANIFAVETINLDDLTFDAENDTPTLAEIPDSPAIQTHQILRFKVPLDDAHRVYEVIERVMKEQGFTKEDSLTNAGNALVHILTNK